MNAILDQHTLQGTHIEQQGDKIRTHLREKYTNPAQQTVIDTIAALTIVGAKGIMLVGKNSSMPVVQFQEMEYFERLGMNGYTVVLKQEPSVELAVYLRSMKQEIINSRNRFVKEATNHCVNSITGGCDWNDVPEGFTGAQKDALLSLNSGLSGVINKAASGFNRLKSIAGWQPNREEAAIRVENVIRERPHFNLGYSKAREILEKFERELNKPFNPKNLIGSHYLFVVANNYFGIPYDELQQMYFSILSDHGVFLSIGNK